MNSKTGEKILYELDQLCVVNDIIDKAEREHFDFISELRRQRNVIARSLSKSLKEIKK